jgi:hypothetical protein
MNNQKLALPNKLLFEFISIAFAVFLGLMLNQWNDNRKNKELAGQSKQNILTEIKENKARIENILNLHEESLSRLDSLLSQFENGQKLDNIALSINFSLLSTSSWETAKLTRAISYMDIETVSDIASTYSYQEYFQFIVKNYLNEYTFNQPEHFDRSFFIKIQNALNVIIPMEKDLIECYSDLETDLLSQE